MKITLAHIFEQRTYKIKVQRTVYDIAEFEHAQRTEAIREKEVGIAER